MASPYAFVTLVSSDSYLPGALAQAAALRDVHPSPPVDPEVEFQTVCLVTPETVDVSTIKLLRKAFNVVIGVEVLEQENPKNLILLGRPDLNTVLTKLHIFRLTQYSKIIFLDADVLPIRPLSHLFKLPHDFSAAPDVGWPDIFNSGVMVLSPGEDKFSELQELLKSKGSWDGGDQGILNEWRGGDWNRLSFTYNTTPTAAYTYAPAYERYGSQISAIHFIGPNKPWKSIAYRAPFANDQRTTNQFDSSSQRPQQAYDYKSLVDKWFDVYDRHYRSTALSPQPEFAIQRYSPAWDNGSASLEISSPGTTVSAPTVLSLEDLRKLAIEGLSSSGMPSQHLVGEGEYKSLPLDGRVDLMRPRREPPKEVPADHDFPGKGKGDVIELEDTVSTPLAYHAVFQNDPPLLHQNPSTPGPNELPPSLRPQLVPLPWEPSHSRIDDQPFIISNDQSEAQQPLQQHTHQSQSEEQVKQEKNIGHGNISYVQQPSLPSRQQSHNERHESEARPEVGVPFQMKESQPVVSQQSEQHTRHEEVRRPISPPLLIWNPAVEPPPTTAPALSSFPADTYFPNIWDRSPSRHHDQVHQGQSPLDSGGFFRPPPTSEIPISLIRQGHYRNVTGEDPMGVVPSPDRNKVKTVFPWEEKPRHLPGRVFPESDAPSPSLFLSPGSQTSTIAPSTPESKPVPIRTHQLSPLQGFPPNLTYANAWDTIPSIQKYASKLVRPPQTNLAAPFDEEGWTKKHMSWDERLEANSRDGDDEDNADEEDDKPPLLENKSDDSDYETSKSVSLRRSRSSSSVSAHSTSKGKKREYRSLGVQTTIIEQRNQAVQVDPPRPTKERKSSVSSKRNSASSTNSSLILPVTREVSAKIDLPMSTAVPSPTSELPPRTHNLKIPLPIGSPSQLSPLRSPREFVVSPSQTTVRPVSPKANHTPARQGSPPKPTVRTSKVPAVVARQISNDSTVGSPPSSIGPLSPQDGQPISPPFTRKGTRVWDPARGVDLFKRGSEEVLARFLKMGSWEDEH